MVHRLIKEKTLKHLDIARLRCSRSHRASRSCSAMVFSAMRGLQGFTLRVQALKVQGSGFLGLGFRFGFG